MVACHGDRAARDRKRPLAGESENTADVRHAARLDETRPTINTEGKDTDQRGANYTVINALPVLGVDEARD